MVVVGSDAVRLQPRNVLAGSEGLKTQVQTIKPWFSIVHEQASIYLRACTIMRQ